MKHKKMNKLKIIIKIKNIQKKINNKKLMN